MPVALIEGKTFHYQDVGEGYPLLFGHSYLWDSSMWAPQIEQLSKQYRCIAVDLLSHGESDALEKTSSIEVMARDHFQLMQHLKIDKFGVIGLSVGGMWATQLALSHPSSVEALVLMGTYVGAEPFLTQFKYFKLLDFLEKEEGFTNPLLDLVVPLFFSPYTLKNNPALVQGFRTKLSQLKKENIGGVVRLGRAIFSRPSLLKQLSQMQQKTLIITGQDDIPRPPKEAQEMAKLLPNATLHIIENAGHISNLEKPDEITTLLSDFLKKSL